MEKVFIYWDNPNIFNAARQLAEEREQGPDARRRLRINFENLYHLARNNREVARARAAGLMPPEARRFWSRLEGQGVQVDLIERGTRGISEHENPGLIMQQYMLEDALDFNGDPGIAVMLTGESAGCYSGAGYHRALARMRQNNWRIEVLSWERACDRPLKEWAEQNGVFIPLDDYYEAITYLEPSDPGPVMTDPRQSAELDLSLRAC
ncbi:MAG: hypothetical protein MPK31_07105 [Gammaproteobacteria bacterium]|nr:hypothetical protein [Gammaproteobacteria bacterium]MDA7991321.1 hypothetical protein [Gammaproteobacteria bacterium]